MLGRVISILMLRNSVLGSTELAKSTKYKWLILETSIFPFWPKYTFVALKQAWGSFIWILLCISCVILFFKLHQKWKCSDVKTIHIWVEEGFFLRGTENCQYGIRVSLRGIEANWLTNCLPQVGLKLQSSRPLPL
jgi:hypothetical protein